MIEAQGPRVTVKAVADTTVQDLQRCDAVVIGASIRYGKHKPEVGAFIAQHQAALEERARGLAATVAKLRDLPPPTDFPQAPGQEPHLKGLLATVR